jgi:DNA-binding transcriptional MocR family regulator
MSGFQNPLGATMPEEANGELVTLLTPHNIALIEDDPYAELYFGSVRPKPAKAFDRQGLVLHCGSFSKCLAPGYRVGWITAGRYREDVDRLKFVTSIATASLPQAPIAEYRRHGEFDRHLRQALDLQLHRLTNAIGDTFPEGTHTTRPQGGYQLRVKMPAKVDALQLFDEALAKKISIPSGPIFSAEHKFRNRMRMTFGHPWSARTDDAVHALGKLAARMMR